MSEIGIFEAKTKLSELCTRVEEAGVEYTITRRGRPVARITGIAPRRETAVGLLERMAQTVKDHGPITEEVEDFPDVWLDRRSRRKDPVSDAD